MQQTPLKKNKDLQIRVTSEQYERIRNNAIAKGCVTISEYLRKLALGSDMSFERKFNEIYNEIMKRRRSNPNHTLKKQTEKNQEDLLI